MRFLWLLVGRRYGSRWTGVARRLRQHVVLGDHHFTVAALGIALLALKLDLVPIWRGDLFERPVCRPSTDFALHLPEWGTRPFFPRAASSKTAIVQVMAEIADKQKSGFLTAGY